MRRLLVAGVAVALAGGLAAAPASTAQAQGGEPGSYTLEQTLSDRAQLTTIAFDALGFLTGSLGADSFFPPGKVADFWGFQSLRDNDPTGMGHNTDFLTSAALTMLSVLTPGQRGQLLALAASQVDEINEYARDRFTLMTAFRRLLARTTPPGAPTLSLAAVRAYSADLYRLDGRISLERAAVMGPILASLSANQRASLDAIVGTGMATWPAMSEPADLRGLDHDTKVAVMTYAGDLLSWYAGDVEDDVYFCPERQGTYFGSFYLKDAPAVGNPGYSIGTGITGDMGSALLAVLNARQSRLITSLVDRQRATLEDIVQVRRQISTALRGYRTGSAPDTSNVIDLMARYGRDDGSLVHMYATAFATVDRTLTAGQRSALDGLRTDTIGEFTPAAAYLYATPIAAPSVPATDFLFAIATAPKGE